jgi:RHS repeat-associated protein
MIMPGRKYTAPSSSYRYGYNGKENDNEIKGEGNQQDYGMRIYDPRLMRFLSVDPIESEFPWNSPYAFAENDPINFIDLDGLEKAKPATYDMAKQLMAIVGNNIKSAQTQLEKTTDEAVKTNLQVSIELNKRTYRALAVFVYQNQPTSAERAADIMRRLEPAVNEFLDITSAGSIKVIATGSNFKGQPESRLGAVGWLAFDIFGGQILKGLGRAGTAIKAISGKGKGELEAIIKKVNNTVTALDETHIRAAVNDIFGNPVVINGKTYDHLKEVTNALNGITKEIKKLNKVINNTGNEKGVIEAATELRNTLSNQKDEINSILDRARKSVEKKKSP